VLPSKVTPLAAPEPPLLKVSAPVTAPAVVAVAALPEQAAAIVAVAALPEQADAVVAVAALPEQAAAVVALAALPLMLMPQVPDAPAPETDGAPTLL
jgi:hypothetical protein